MDNEAVKAVSEIVASRGGVSACVHSYGCQLNFSDGEKIKGLLRKMGFTLTDSPESASLVIFNTCAVRENAEDRVFGNLGMIKHRKEQGQDIITGLCGCMSGLPHVREKIERSYRFVDIIFDNSSMEKLPGLLLKKLIEGGRVYCDYDCGMPPEELEPVRDSRFKASVPIMYGCNNFCTYCIVPYVRGRERSRQPEDILREVKQLVRDGYKEIMLLGQNVNSYGSDLETDIDFCGLLKLVNAVEGDFVIRFMSSHPKDAGPALIDAILSCEKAEKHLHLPVQSGSDGILDKMNRRYTVEKYMETVDYARSRVSDFSFTTDIIVGFPGESEEDFEKTLELIKRVKYDNIYSFIYSKRSGTKAALMDDPVSDKEKGARMTRLLDIQRDITSESYKRFIGRELRVLAESASKREGYLTGKSREFIIVEFEGEESLIGQFVNVEITEARNWAVVGVMKRSN